MGKGTGRFVARDILFAAVIIAVVSLVVFLSLTGKKRFISRTQAHLAAAGIRDKARADAFCVSCHAVDAAAVVPVESAGSPLPENHPLRKKNCRQCHQLERKKP